jgi:hypothetical protein
MQAAGKGLPVELRFVADRFGAVPHLRTLFRSLTFIVAVLLSGPLSAAGSVCAQTGDSKPDELEEVVISGAKTSRTKDLSAWLRLLEGQYRYEGHVDLCSNGHVTDQRPVTGKADCALLNPSTEPTRNVYCIVNVRWPEDQGKNEATALAGRSGLSPAMVLYGLAPGPPAIQSVQIDNRGITTQARGELSGDTLTLRERCVGTPGLCQKVTRITASPDSNDVVMLIDFEIESRRVARQAFLMHRVTNIPKGLLWMEVS